MLASNKLNFSLKKKIILDRDFSSYKLNVLNKMQARKLSQLHKVAIDLIFDQIDLDGVDYIVSSSQHGELNISDNLISDLIEGRSLSPTKFSQSTHNALVGNLSVLSKQRTPVTAISAGINSFSMGLLSAVSCLQYESSCVLYLYTESAPPERYQKVVNCQNIIIVLLLERGNDYSLSVNEQSLDLSLQQDVEFKLFTNWSYQRPLQIGNLLLQKNEENLEIESDILI